MKNIIAGVDEVGRGAIAGPVIEAAVILKKDIEDLKDTKKISEKKRIELSNKIKKYSYFAIGSASHNEIDKFNILNASLFRSGSTDRHFKQSTVFLRQRPCSPNPTFFFRFCTSPFKNTSFSFSFMMYVGFAIVSP